jgi:TRAP-type transport system small permease protein
VFTIPVLKTWLERLSGALAAVALFAIMALTLVDVAGRKAINTSVPGSLELTELLMVVVIFAGLPLVSLRGEHVVFDSLDAMLSSRLVRLQTAVMDVLCAAALAGVAWLMWVKAGQIAAFGDTTAALKIPQAPFVVLMSLLCGLTAFIHLLLVLAPVTHHHPGVNQA